MKTTLYYYTGTGNSLWTARLLATELGDSTLLPMTAADPVHDGADTAAIGLVFPVHMWGVPAPVLQFIKRLPGGRDRYFFAAAVNAGGVSRTLVQVRRAMAAAGLSLAAGFSVVLPSNYIPWGGPKPEAERQNQYQATREKIKLMAARLVNRETWPVEKGPLWQRIVFTAIYKLTFNMILKMDKDFWVDTKCTACGLCATVCPAHNIELQEGKPVWRHRCEQCLACIQWCPQEAIQYGKKTPGYARYHHPEVGIGDLQHQQAGDA
jgi:ferredoxin